MKPVYKKYLTTIAFIWAGCLVVFAFVYILLLAPQRKSVKHLEKQLAEKKQMCLSAQKAAQEETKTRLNEQIEQLRYKLGQFVIDPEDSANLIFDISQIANEKAVDSFSIKSRDNTRGSAIPDCSQVCENQIDISFTGNFNQFATFLNALERHRPVVFIDKFAITRSDRDSSSHQVSMTLAVLVKKQQDS